ncbi:MULTISPECIES: phosphopantetheine-binding protein [Kitasatospora]|uniref:Putative non-ribosomal peptide synthetase phosphopantetheine domain protein n=1 Tax=Kitasatospora setae (strain ATCC 33774 / DSM 43861 / JCM 3304 / KCC A-0304 / NBRC 14216 / KM-6054) TaxID=452652 RepID=E4NA53_KITSK|nr:MULTISPECIES: phosphopantetheine-binding protein [Kitasatospora]BAJ28084.1 putative non-ribosomal peptide synthetase phosphopantetheine domain protein [Kitasatospora setae KM-6054]
MDTATADEFTRFLRPYCRELPPDRALTDDTLLVEVGIDSLLVVELVTAIEDHYGIEFPEELLAPDTFTTPGTLRLALEPLL